MNVTESRKDRKPRREGYPQKVSAEQRGYAEASVCRRITENNRTITTNQMDKMLERIIHRENLNKAYKKVKSNKGAGGVDGMSVDELLPYLKETKMQLLQQKGWEI